MISFEDLVVRCKNDEDILAVILFGSRARGDASSNSDVDICFLLMPRVMFPTVSYEQQEKTAFDKRITYMADFDIDLHVYHQVPLYIRQRVLKEAKVLFCRDEEMLYEIACYTITEFADYEHIYRDYLKEIERG